MTRYPKFMVGAVSAAALALPFAMTTAGHAQEAPVETPLETVAQEATPAAEDAVSFIEFKTPPAPAEQTTQPAKEKVAQAAPAEVQTPVAAEPVAEPVQATRQIVVEQDADKETPKTAATADEKAAQSDPAPAAKTEDVAQATPVTTEPVATAASEVATPTKAQPADAAQSTRQIVVEQKTEDATQTVAAKTEETPATPEAAPATETQAQPEAAPAEQQAADTTSEAEQVAVAKPEADVADKKAEAPAKRDTLEIVAELQTELKRVGCYFGAIDGVWGPRSAHALDSYSEFAEVEHDSYEPSDAWIAHVKAQKDVVCHKGHYYGYAKPTYRQDYYGYHSPYSYQDSYGGDYYGRGGYYGRY